MTDIAICANLDYLLYLPLDSRLLVRLWYFVFNNIGKVNIFYTNYQTLAYIIKNVT